MNSPYTPNLLPIQRTLRRRLFRVVNIFIQVAVVLTLTVQGGFGAFVPRAAQASGQTVNLDQYANGKLSPPGTPSWQNGNLNANNSHYVEGETVPFRLSMDNLDAGSHTIHLNYDYTNYDYTAGGVFAYDFLTNYNATINPALCDGLTGFTTVCASSPALASITADPDASGFQIPGNLRAYGATSASLGGYTLSGPLSGNSTKDVTLTFSVASNNSKVVLVWGGHLASSINHGTGLGASSISGSPFHMRTQQLDGSGNKNQDRSIQPGAVLLGSITLTKVVDSGSATPTDWSFTISPDPAGTGPLSPTSGQSTVAFPSLPAGTYSVSESTLAGYHQVSTTCNDLAISGSSTSTLNQSCTIHNARDQGTVTFQKIVNGGSAQPSDWTFTVSGVQGTFHSGDSTTLPTGTYTVTESGPAGYASSAVSGICSNLNGSSATLTMSGQGGTCTFTNTAQPGTLTVIKHVEGGTAVAGNFTMHVTNGTPTNFPGSEAGTAVSVPASTSYAVTEDPVTGYTSSFSADCTGTMPAGGAKTCTVTNTRDTGTLRVKKHVVGGTAEAADWQLHVKQSDSDVAGSPQAGSETGTVYTLPTGNYDVSETNGPSDYTASFSASCPNGAITVVKDQEATCTITNTRDTARVTFDKVILGGGPAVDANFAFAVDGSGTYHDGDGVTLNTNTTHAVTESSQYSNLYTLTGASGVCSLDQGSIVLNVGAQGGTCVVTNTRNTGSITGTKFNDLNGDGTKDVGEPGVEGVTIHLSSGPQTTTDSSGNYSFASVPTDDYSVSEDVPTHWTPTTPTTRNVTVVTGETVTADPFGNFHNVSVTACKVEDTDGDTQTTGDQTPVPGWTVKLWTNGQLTDTQVTGENGCRTWSDLGPATYAASEVVPADWLALTPTTHDFGSAVSGEQYSTTFANFHKGSISGHKYEDTNGNGIYDAGTDQPVADWTIMLGGSASASTTTDQNGEYHFTDLGPGTYTVAEDVQTGWVQTFPSFLVFTGIVLHSDDSLTGYDFGNFHRASITGTKWNDLDADGPGGPQSPVANWPIELWMGDQQLQSTTTDADGHYTFSALGPGTYTVKEGSLPGWIPAPSSNTQGDVTMVSGQTVAGPDFWNVQLGSISGHKYEDHTADGASQDDTPLADWYIYLWQGNDLVQVVQTGIDGTYSFTDLEPGSYQVTENLEDGWTPTYSPQGSFGITSGTTYTNVDFGNFRKGSISGYKFNDLNGNGAWDEGEPGLNGWEICLNGEDCQTTHNDGSDAPGFYQFSDLTHGSYDVSETNQDGWTQTTVNYEELSIDSGSNLTGKDFGNFELGRIEGFKYDNQENGLPGWQICLDGPNEFQQCTLTNADGHYAFDGLMVGTYTVSETNQYGWTQLEPTDPGTHAVDVTSGTGQGGEHQNYNFVNRLNAFDVSIVKTGAATVEAGAQITYTLHWSVTGNIPVTNVTVTDPLPANTSFASADLGGTESAGTVTWNLGTKNPGDSGDVHLTVNVSTPLTNGTVLTNTGTVCGEGALIGNFDGDPQATTTCKDDTTTTTVHSQPVGHITKTASPSPVNAGENISYTVTWSITGNAPSTNTVLTDPIPLNTTFVSVADGGTYDAGTNTLTWNLGTKNPGDGGAVHFVVRTATPLTNGTAIANTASLKSAEIDPAIDSTAVVPVASAPILTIVKTDSPDPVAAGANLTYTLAWTVGGNAPATNVVLTDPLPANTTFVSAGSGGTYDAGANTVTWNLGAKTPPDLGTVSFVVKVKSPLANGTVLTNTATIDSTETPPVSDTETTMVASAPVLTITKVNNAATFVNPGATVTYTVTVTNATSATDSAHGVSVTDLLPAGFTLVIGGGSSKTYTLGDLAPGASVVTTYAATVAATQAAGLYTNTATVTASNAPAMSASSNVEVRVPRVLPAIAVATLALTKTADVPYAGPDTTVTYTLTVKNVGDATAENVVLHDTLPAGFTFVNGGGRTKEWKLGNLDPGTARVISYQVHLASSVRRGSYTNVATAAANNTPTVTASHTLPVKVSQVLPAETGTGPLDYAIAFLGALLLLLGAAGLWRTTRSNRSS